MIYIYNVVLIIWQHHVRMFSSMLLLAVLCMLYSLYSISSSCTDGVNIVNVCRIERHWDRAESQRLLSADSQLYVYVSKTLLASICDAIPIFLLLCVASIMPLHDYTTVLSVIDYLNTWTWTPFNTASAQVREFTGTWAWSAGGLSLLSW